jgi:hypothetical protein
VVTGPRLSRRPAAPPRDTDASSFAPILGDFIARVPGAFAAVLVDSQGECVDYAGRGLPFDLRVAAAHWRIVLDEIGRSTLGRPISLTVRGTKKSYLCHVLPDDYALVVLLSRRAGFVPVGRAVASCVRALHFEARWPPPQSVAAWFPVKVTCDRSRRPRAARLPGGPRHTLEVLGAVVGLAKRDRAFRVRLDSGLELTLVREPGNFWYADEALDSGRSGPTRPR